MAELDATKPTSEQQGATKMENNTAPKPHSNPQHTQNQQSSHSVVTVGNFEIGQTIGRGTFGKVKLGIHKITNEKVAVKVLDKDKLIDSADKKRLQREIAILRKIRHPSIIQLYEIIETPRQLYLFMEYAPNGELFDYIVKRTRLSEKQASKFLQQIINGIEYIAKIGVVHRDLKPENLLLDHNFNIKIVDFGLSNTYKENEKLKTACGSPCYAAPEMVAGKPYNGLQTDIWSSGVILYAMLCGYLPFEDQNTSVLYKKIMNQDPVLPNFLSQNSKGIISGVLAKDPEKRYSIQDIRLHPFCKEREPVLQGIIVGIHEIPIDQNILKQLEKYQINLEQAEDMVKRNKHNNMTSIYNLLLLKFIREGGKSNADLLTMKKARSGHFKVAQVQNLQNLSSQQQEYRQKNVPALQTVSTAAPPSTAINSNSTQIQDNEKEELKTREDFSPLKIGIKNPAQQVKARELSQQTREQDYNKEKYQNKYHSVSPQREQHGIEGNNNNNNINNQIGKKKGIEISLRDNQKTEIIDIRQGKGEHIKAIDQLDSSFKQQLPRLTQGNAAINSQQKRNPFEKTNIQQPYQKKPNNFIDSTNLSSNAPSVPNQSKKQSIVRITNLNNSSMFDDTKELQKQKVNSSFQQVNASKYSGGDDDDKLIMINSVQTNSTNKNGKQQVLKRILMDSTLNTTQESPRTKNNANLSMLLQKNYQFPSNIAGANKTSNPNNTSLNSFSKTRYLSVQRPNINNKVNSQSPSIEEKKNFRISSYSIHMRGNSTQYNTRGSNDSVMNLSLNQAVTQNVSKRASINSIKPIPLQEKLININIQNNNSIMNQNKRIRKKIISSMNDSSYNSKNNSFNVGKINKENNASNTASKNEIKVNNMEFLNYNTVNNNLNYSLELDIETAHRNYSSQQSQNASRINKFENDILKVKGIQRVHTDENDKININKQNHTANINAANNNINQHPNNNNTNILTSSQRNKKPETSKSENIKLNKIIPISIPMAQINNNFIQNSINCNNKSGGGGAVVAANPNGGGSSQSSSRILSYKFRKVKPNFYEEQFNFIGNNDSSSNHEQ